MRRLRKLRRTTARKATNKKRSGRLTRLTTTRKTKIETARSCRAKQVCRARLRGQIHRLPLYKAMLMATSGTTRATSSCNWKNCLSSKTRAKCKTKSGKKSPRSQRNKCSGLRRFRATSPTLRKPTTALWPNDPMKTKATNQVTV